MASTLKLDGFSLYPFLRVAQGEGLDPVDPNHVAPQFADAAAGEGEPLLSVHAGNREMIFPLYINPTLCAGYATSTDGLSQLVRDLHRLTAGGQVLEWADEGASASTFMDVTFARLEVEYDYRRRQKLWLKAALHVWGKPYGHTGTSRIVATAAATMSTPAVTASSVDGDVAAALDVFVNVTNPAASHPNSGLVVGFAVTRPEASLMVGPGRLQAGSATVTGASGALASSVIRAWMAGSPASTNLAMTGGMLVPAGRHRIMGLLRHTVPTVVATGVSFSGSDTEGNVFGATVVIPSGATGWNVVDLGVFNARADRQLGVNLFCAAVAQATSLPSSAFVDCCALLALPEDGTVTLLDPDPGKQGYSAASYSLFATGPARSFGTASQMAQQPVKVDSYQRGANPGLDPVVSTPMQGQGPTAPPQVVAFAFAQAGAQNNTVAVDVRVRERFTYVR